MATYNYVTQGTFLAQLASRLYDPTEQFWSHAEKTLYLQEALHCWNAITASFRGEFIFTPTLNTTFYDLTTLANSLRPVTLFDTDIYSIIQYHLLEPATGVNPWAGVSTQFSADDLINAVSRRRDELLSITGCTVTRHLLPATPGRITLSDTTLDIRRVAYAPGTNQFTSGTLIQSSGGTLLNKFQSRIIVSSVAGHVYQITGTYQNLASVPVIIRIANSTGSSSSSQTIPPNGFANISLTLTGDGSTFNYRIETQSIADSLLVVGLSALAFDTTTSTQIVALSPTFQGAWIGVSGTAITLTQGVQSLPTAATALFPDDAWSMQSFNRGYTTSTPGTPSAYLLSTQPPLSFDVDRPPGFAGQYDLITVDAGVALNAQIPAPLSIPDDWAHVIKWGALADLLSREGNATDPTRAAYCEQRYRMGAALLTDAPALLSARVNNVPVMIDAMRNADMYTRNWQGLTPGTPATILQSGMNLIALTPTPPATPVSVTLSVIANAPIPVNDAANVQVARDVLDSILDYAQHLSLFKAGGKEFTDSMPLLQGFLKMATLYNSKLSEWGEFSQSLLRTSQTEAGIAPRTEPIAATAQGGQ